MKKIIPIIVSAVIFLGGCAAALTGIFMNNRTEEAYPELAPFAISDSDVGKMFGISLYPYGAEEGRFYNILTYTSNTAEPDFLLTGAENEDGNGITLPMIMPKSISDMYFQEKYETEPFLIVCAVRKSGDEIKEKAIEGITGLYDTYKTVTDDETVLAETEAVLRKAYENLCPYYLEIYDEAAKASAGDIYIWTGCAVMGLAVIILLTVLLGKKFLIALAAVILLFAIILLITLSGKLRTMSTVTEVSDGLYKMTCRYDYNCDKFINADISTIDEFVEWAGNEHFFGLPIEFDANNFGCSAFTAATPEGQRLFGRNFDYDEADTLVFYTEPENGYASYGVSDLKLFDIGKNCSLDGNSLPAKALMLMAPYATMDGINEAGLGVGILQLSIDELHQDMGKSDLLIFAAIRGILDKCATVDEAITLLENYDIHSFLSCSYHLFITDRTGRSVIVEWADNDTFIVEDTVCTNDVMSSDNRFYNPGWSCDRYDTIKKWLSEKNNILTETEAMQAASDASWDSKDMTRGTEWSCVYNLDEFTFTICTDRDYKTPFTFTNDDFR